MLVAETRGEAKTARTGSVVVVAAAAPAAVAAGMVAGLALPLAAGTGVAVSYFPLQSAAFVWPTAYLRDGDSCVADGLDESPAWGASVALLALAAAEATLRPGVELARLPESYSRCTVAMSSSSASYRRCT